MKKKQKQKRNDSGDICSDTIVKSPVHTNPDIFKSTFIYIFHMNQPSVLCSVHT